MEEGQRQGQGGVGAIVGGLIAAAAIFYSLPHSSILLLLLSFSFGCYCRCSSSFLLQFLAHAAAHAVTSIGKKIGLINNPSTPSAPFSSSSSGPSTGLSHLVLPGVARVLIRPALPSWCNFGLWERKHGEHIQQQHTQQNDLPILSYSPSSLAPYENPSLDQFSSACQRLAALLAVKGNIQHEPNNSIRMLDAGCGCGDSSIFWLAHFPSVSSIDAFNTSPHQIIHAQRKQRENNEGQLMKRAEEKGSNGDAADGLQERIQRDIHFYVADAVDLNALVAEAAQRGRTPRKVDGRADEAERGEHGINDGDEYYDRIFSLDSAYHFRPRTLFLSHAHRLLRPNGIVALVDFCAMDNLPWWKRMLLYTLAKPSGIPPINLYDHHTYRTHLLSCGYEILTMEDISAAMMRPFIHYIHNIWAPSIFDFANSIGWPIHGISLRFQMVALFLALVERLKLARFVIVVARKPGMK